MLDLCREAAARLGQPAAELRRLADQLGEPQVKVAVVGRVSSGKSTLVNALVGRRIAPTDASECTRAVTCYRYGHRPAATAHLRDGPSCPLSVNAVGDLVLDLPVPTTRLSHVEVQLPVEALRDVTILDCPGISSANRDISEQTHGLLSHRWYGAPAPDAVAFVLTQGLRDDENELLATIDRPGNLLPPAVNTVGVLTKADLVGGGGPDAWPAAERLATSIATDQRSRFTAVVPVIGLLAEAGLCARLTERHAAWLASLAADWTPQDRDIALLSPDLFAVQPATLDGAHRAELLRLIGLAGVQALLGYVDSGITSATALNAACRRLSGFDTLDGTLVERFRERADALKAARALSTVLAAAHGALGRKLTPRQRSWLRDRVEEVRYDCRTHRILELETLHRVLSGQVDLPCELHDDLVYVVQRGGRASRGLGVAEWQRYEARAASAGQRAVARVMVRTYTLSVHGPLTDSAATP